MKKKSDMNNGQYLNGKPPMHDPAPSGSQTVSTTKYVDDYTSKQKRQEKKSHYSREDDSNIITREMLQRDSVEANTKNRHDKQAVLEQR